MRKGAMALILVSMLIAVGLCGCTDETTSSSTTEIKRFIGDWKVSYTDNYGTYDKIITFTSDRKYFVDGSQSGIYSLADSRLEILVTADYSVLYDYSFANNDTSLTLISVGSTVGTTYTKQ